MSVISDEVRELAAREYEHGFSTDIDTDVIPKGLSEDVVRLISSKKNEPDWLLQWRLQAYRQWLTINVPDWQNAHYEPIDFQDISYYAAPKPKPVLGSMD